MHFFLIPSPDIQCAKWSNCKSTMAAWPPSSFLAHLSTPHWSRLEIRSAKRLDSCSALFQFQWAKCRGSHIACPRWAINRLLLYSDLPQVMDEGGGGRVIHSKTMHPKCINRKSVCLQLFSWMFLHLGHYFMQARKTNTSESNHETSNKKTAQCKTFKIGIRWTKPFPIPCDDFLPSLSFSNKIFKPMVTVLHVEQCPDKEDLNFRWNDEQSNINSFKDSIKCNILVENWINYRHFQLSSPAITLTRQIWCESHSI